ncbi:MAG: hypothetical protein ACRDH7_13480 [Actinomycetota bacterium]
MDQLQTYLSDHLSGSIVAIDLARRRALSQGDNEIGTELRRFAAEVERDQRTLRSIIATLGASPSIVKELIASGTAWVDSIRSALNLPGAPNLVRDLELLIMGVRGKELLWGALEKIGVETDPPIHTLQDRAAAQLSSLDVLHACSVEQEFGSSRLP